MTGKLNPSGLSFGKHNMEKRKEVDNQVEEFLRNGGSIKVIRNRTAEEIIKEHKQSIVRSYKEIKLLV